MSKLTGRHGTDQENDLQVCGYVESTCIDVPRGVCVNVRSFRHVACTMSKSKTSSSSSAMSASSTESSDSKTITGSRSKDKEKRSSDRMAGLVS